MIKTINCFPSLLGGRFEEAVLLSLLRLEKPVSATEIRQDLEQHLFPEAQISIGVLYATLDRLEKKEFISCVEMGPTGIPGGRSKRIFSITLAGKESIKEIKSFNQRAWTNVTDKSIELHGKVLIHNH